MQKYCGCHTEQLLTRYEKRGISRNATPAPRNEVTQRMKSPKVTAFAALIIGTAIRTSSERQGAAADGCERLRTVANGCEWLGKSVRRLEHNPQTSE